MGAFSIKIADRHFSGAAIFAFIVGILIISFGVCSSFTSIKSLFWHSTKGIIASSDSLEIHTCHSPKIDYAVNISYEYTVNNHIYVSYDFWDKVNSFTHKKMLKELLKSILHREM